MEMLFGHNFGNPGQWLRFREWKHSTLLVLGKQESVGVEERKNRGGKHEAKSGLAGTRCVGVLAGWLVDFTRSDRYFEVVL